MIMIQEEIDKKIKERIETRVAEAAERMKNLPKSQAIFEELTKQGYVEEMKCFRNVVFSTLLLHPDWTDDDILMDILDKMNN